MGKADLPSSLNGSSENTKTRAYSAVADCRLVGISFVETRIFEKHPPTIAKSLTRWQVTPTFFCFRPKTNSLN